MQGARAQQQQQQQEEDIKRRAKASLLAEVLFVFLPLIAMTIVMSAKGNVLSIFSEAEWAFTAAVLAGQSVVRLSRIVASCGPARGSYLALILTVTIVLVLVPSLTVLVLVLIMDPVPLGLVIAQVALFFVSLGLFFVFGLVGDLIQAGVHAPRHNSVVGRSL